MRRTKIIATIGPATSTPEQIAALIDAGMDVARLNFSHGTHTDHARHIATVRATATSAARSVAILQDLQGPKIRTGALRERAPVVLTTGQSFTITTRPVPGDAQQVSTTYELLPTDVHPGDRILLSDGLIELQVIRTTATDTICEVVHGGNLREHQGINLPGVNVSASSVTPKDLEDLDFGLAHDVDYVALSFVRCADDILSVKEHMARRQKLTPVIAKIERSEAVERLADILAVTDGVMIARGDLGVELPPAQVPIVQKQIIEAANRMGIPVITATQMLESMILNPRPTRAETSDVANAIIDGTDAIMLSGETAVGQYPIESLKMMTLVAEIVEASGRHGDRSTTPRWALPDVRSVDWAIGAAASAIVQTIPIRAIVVFTQTGNTARMVAHYRPTVPIIAFTPSEQVYRRLSLLWGVIPLRTEPGDSLQQLEPHFRAELIQRGYAEPGDMIVITGGHPTYMRAQTNFLKIHTL